jgi:hypothetical protein
MTDYPELYQRLAQEILKRDGQISADTAAFIKQFVAKLQAEGWQLSGDAETALNSHLSGINTVIKDAIGSAVAVASGLPLTPANLQSETVLKLAEQAFVESWPDGLTLSDRIWRWQKDTRTGVQQQLQAGIRQGKAVNAVLYDMQRAIERGGNRFKIVTDHADDWVTELHASATALIHDPAAKAAWKVTVGEAEERISMLKATGSRHAAERVLDQVKQAVAKGSEELVDKAVKWWLYDKQLYNLKRIARTEMATAGHRAVIASVEGDESIIGFQWRLSSSHPVADICDYYANIEMGLGKGVWTKDAVPHHKAHPHCMCLIIPRVTPIQQKGSKNYAEFVQNATPERKDQLLPKWAGEAVKNGVDLKRLIRPDGQGLIAKKDATQLLNVNRAENIIAKLAENTKNAQALTDFWANPQSYRKHVDKRVELGHIKDADDYYHQVKTALVNADRFNMVNGTYPSIELVSGEWSVILTPRPGKNRLCVGKKRRYVFIDTNPARTYRL